ncbi:MAG: GMC family oxidoreductase [Gemmatimonadales bacterium]|nr:GMC family oxidoreductase [Gemmatimonadales bacterium]
MILDAKKGFGQELPRYDSCIVGAGAAGITLALELEATGRRVCLLEAGGPGYEAATQRLYEGQVVGQPYPILRDTRVSALGGSTTVWAGWCRPLEALDFERRDWCGACGWPFGLDQLRPYYARAHAICGLADFDYAPQRWTGVLGSDRLFDRDATFSNQIFHVNVQNFAERYHERLRQAKNIDLVLHAPVTRLRMEGPTCTGVQVRTLEGQELTVSAHHFVLAAGGVENSRLLLLSADEPARAPGNVHGLVGRYFTDHAFVDPGWLVLREPGALEFYRLRPVGSTRGASSVRGVLTLRREVVERERLMNAALYFHPRYESHRVFAGEEVKAFLQLWNKFKKRGVPGALWPYARQAARAPHQLVVAIARKLVVGDGPARRWRMRAAFETAFRYDNRVMLSDERDRLGRPKARIEWRIGETDIENMRQVMQRFDQAVRHAGVGHFEGAFPDEPSAWRQAVEGGKHHMGTTRMHVAPEYGVVDENGRVHGTSNLFVTGSSVFPSGGYANPTLTIVALAVRLGDHLSGLRRG